MVTLITLLASKFILSLARLNNEPLRGVRRAGRFKMIVRFVLKAEVEVLESLILSGLINSP